MMAVSKKKRRSFRKPSALFNEGPACETAQTMPWISTVGRCCFPTPNSVSLPSHHVTPTLYHSCFVCWSALTVFPQKSEPESGNS